ncbi:unnamed protein product [Macrosiphum euphorbiae]|uniref:Uncharacterized protein n=1 Tax=Macrosiphum euphorbiae TaxID=13131 RepID=A0AAV0XXJ5_9HEMI|nr:unnamed protein product [Macrosiphum euphorbiae]
MRGLRITGRRRQTYYFQVRQVVEAKKGAGGKNRNGNGTRHGRDGNALECGELEGGQGVHRNGDLDKRRGGEAGPKRMSCCNNLNLVKKNNMCMEGEIRRERAL